MREATQENEFNGVDSANSLMNAFFKHASLIRSNSSFSSQGKKPNDGDAPSAHQISSTWTTPLAWRLSEAGETARLKSWARRNTIGALGRARIPLNFVSVFKPHEKSPTKTPLKTTGTLGSAFPRGFQVLVVRDIIQYRHSTEPGSRGEPNEHERERGGTEGGNAGGTFSGYCPPHSDGRSDRPLLARRVAYSPPPAPCLPPLRRSPRSRSTTPLPRVRPSRLYLDSFHVVHLL